MSGGFDEARRVEVGNLAIAYREVGSGDPIVLLHGFPLSSLTWRRVAPELAQEYRCIALDLPGAGQSLVSPDVPLGLDAQARVLGSFLDALEIQRVGLVGQDTGATIARSLAIAQPDRVSQMVLADTDVPGYRPFPVVFAKTAARLPGSRALFRAFARSKRMVRSQAGLGQLFADVAAFDFDEFYEILIEPLSRNELALDSSRRFLREFLFRDVDAARSGYDRLTMPKCLIRGEDDNAMPPKQAARLVAMLPEPTHYELVPRAGLLVHEEQPRAWLRIVRDFLASPPAQRVRTAAHHAQ